MVYTLVEGVLDPLMRQKVLVIGVGRSDVIETLYSKGYRDITAIDISPTIIREMRKKYQSYSGVDFVVMDVRQLTGLSDSIFTLIIDKGCLDALFCGTEFHENVLLAMNELFRVMKPDALTISFSHAPKLARVPYLRQVQWSIDANPVHLGGEGITMFVLTKTTDPEKLNRKIAGAEAGVRKKTSKLVSNMDQTMNKSSTTRSGRNTGSVTVTASVDILEQMVAESAEMDG